MADEVKIAPTTYERSVGSDGLEVPGARLIAHMGVVPDGYGKSVTD
jgi:hypothetical protein